MLGFHDKDFKRVEIYMNEKAYNSFKVSLMQAVKEYKRMKVIAEENSVQDYDKDIKTEQRCYPQFYYFIGHADTFFGRGTPLAYKFIVSGGECYLMIYSYVATNNQFIQGQPSILLTEDEIKQAINVLGTTDYNSLKDSSKNLDELFD